MSNKNPGEPNGLANDEEDDDFGDFGGFEAAEPVAPHVAQPPPAGLEAAPNPWAVFSPASSAVSAQPDLLCGQNRFPQHLDTPATVDVAGGAAANADIAQVDGQNQLINGQGFPYDPDFDLERDLPVGNPQLDNVNLANEILDGSFRSVSSNHSGASLGSHAREQPSGISGLDLAQGTWVDNPAGDSASGQNVELNEPLPGILKTDHVTGDRLSAGDHVTSSEQAGNIPDLNVNNDNSNLVEQLPPERNIPAAKGGGDNSAQVGVEAVRVQGLLEKAEVEKIKAQKEVEKLQLTNTRLTEELSQTQETLEKSRQDYQELQKKHDEQISELRQAGHDALSLVVEEYKELLKTTVLQQQEASERRLVERLKEETERFHNLQEEQNENFQQLMKEERETNEEKMRDLLAEQAQKEKERFENFLSEERHRSDERLEAVVKAEREAAAKEIEKTIEEERNQAKEKLQEQQESFNKQLAEEMEKNKQLLQEAVAEERKKSQDHADQMVTEERQRSREMVTKSVETTREEMRNYLQEQRKCDKAVNQRQLASLDLFLQSARHQLDVLMNKDADVDQSDDASQSSKS